jgi:hypothetical protein
MHFHFCRRPMLATLTGAAGAFIGWKPLAAPFIGWKPFTTYQERLTFGDAEAFCVSRGGSLASLQTRMEVEEVWRQSRGNPSWIGLRRASIADPWGWSDGSSYGRDVIGADGEVALWHSEQGRDTLCGGWRSGDSSGSISWDSVPCTELLPFTCRNAHWKTRFLATVITEDLVLVSATPRKASTVAPSPPFSLMCTLPKAEQSLPLCTVPHDLEDHGRRRGPRASGADDHRWRHTTRPTARPDDQSPRRRQDCCTGHRGDADPFCRPSRSTCGSPRRCSSGWHEHSAK